MAFTVALARRELNAADQTEVDRRHHRPRVVVPATYVACTRPTSGLAASRPASSTSHGASASARACILVEASTDDLHTSSVHTKLRRDLERDVLPPRVRDDQVLANAPQWRKIHPETTADDRRSSFTASHRHVTRPNPEFVQAI